MGCAAFGIGPPPCRLHIAFLPGRSGWTLLIHSDAGRLPHVERWITQYGPARTHFDAGITPRVLRAEFRSLPERWGVIVDSLGVSFMELTPEGIASIFVDGHVAGTEQLTARLHLPPTAVSIRADLAQGPPDALSRKQFDVLSLAVALGYYEVPHRVDQREIAARLGMSLSATSQLLRKAEATVLVAYVDSRAAAQQREVIAHHMEIRLTADGGPGTRAT